MKKTIALAAIGLFAFGSGTALAKEPPAKESMCTLMWYGDHQNPGQMLQYLRDRTRGATGNPKEVADAYPESFENVGDLIEQKCTPPGHAR